MDNSNSYENELLLCSKCGEIPEIIKIHTDNSKIEFNCKICGKYEILIDEHYDELSKNKFSSDENNSVNNREFYCFDCKKTCNENHSNHNCIEIDEKKRKCLEHNENFQYFCFECRKNLCTIEKKNSHKNHKTIEIKDLTKSLIDNQKKIDDINDALQNIIEFNETILNKAEIFKNEDFYVNSIKNMGKSLEEAKDRNSKDIKCLFNGLSEGIQNSLKAFDYFIDQKKIHLHRDDKCLQLNNQKLVDKDFKCITQISFNQLKEIDISENKIKNIQSFKKMSLPFLEFLNLSFNEIDKIEPITKLNSKNIKYIFLQNNEIEDIEAFLDSNYNYINILRVENYNTKFNNENDENDKNEELKKRKEILNKIEKKYSGRFVYTSFEKQLENFEKNYKCEISKDKENIINEIDLSDIKGGQKMLKALFLIITYKPKNNIKKLILRNNDIFDPSMLNKVNFNKLQTLDLAVNEIKDLKFLLDMKAKNLKYLYLDNNEFVEIHQILKANLPSLEVLSLNENQFNEENMEKAPEYKKLKNKKVEDKQSNNFGNLITIQLKKTEKKITNQTDSDKNSGETKPNS
jgi:Leucine-rich repeat (LRR) protein